MISANSPGLAATSRENSQPPDGKAQQESASETPRPEAQSAEQEKKNQEAQTAQKGQQQEKAKPQTSNKRMFFILPNYLTVEKDAPISPLTPAQKFKLVARGTFDPYQFGYYAVLAGIGQATDAESGYGQGALGYGKRYAAIFGDTTIENFITAAALPSLLHQDPRYFRKAEGGFARRSWYAIRRVFVIRSDSGREEFNSSEIFGSAAAAAISTYSYHPDAQRKIGNVTATWGAQLSGDFYGYLMKEFWPDIHRRLQRKPAAREGSAAGGRN